MNKTKMRRSSFKENYYSDTEGTDHFNTNGQSSRRSFSRGSNANASSKKRYSDTHTTSRKESKIFKLHKKGIYTFEKDGRKYIYGGTEQKIVLKILKWLVTESKRDYVFHLVYVVVNGFRKFHSSCKIFGMFTSLWNFETEKPEQVQVMRSSIMLFLSIWWEKSLEIDFVDGTEQLLEDWLETLTDNYKLPLTSKFYKIKNERKPKDKIDIYQMHTLKFSTNLNLFEMNVETIALHIALNDTKSFQNLLLHEFYSEDRINLNNMVTKSNTCTKWIIGSILERKNTNERAKMMKKIVKVTSKLLEMHDYNGVMTCWAALNSLTVHRLLKTKKRLSRSCLNHWRILEFKLSESKNFSLLRRTINKRRKEGLPLVPWFELIVKGRNLIDEYPDFLDKKSLNSRYQGGSLINFSKLEHLHELIEEFCDCQRNNQEVKLELDPNSNHSKFQEFLEALPEYTDSELWEMSILCEPKKFESKE